MKKLHDSRVGMKMREYCRAESRSWSSVANHFTCCWGKVFGNSSTARKQSLCLLDGYLHSLVEVESSSICEALIESGDNDFRKVTVVVCVPLSVAKARQSS